MLVMIAGFSVLSFVTVLTYTNAPPIPERMVGDGVFLVAGALPIAIGVLRSVWERELSPAE